MVSTTGLMASFMMANGFKIKCMAREYLFGKMERNTMASLSMIKEKVMELFSGQMGDSILENGHKENSMVKEPI